MSVLKNDKGYEDDESGTTLESILKKYFGCRKPFRNTPKIEKNDDGETSYTFLTNRGFEAYDKLVELVYDLEDIGVIRDANEVVEELDCIATDMVY